MGNRHTLAGVGGAWGRLMTGFGTERRLIALTALAWFSYQCLLFTAKGPDWILIPQDLGYNYLFNGLNILRGDPPGTLIHPAITTIHYYAGLTWLIHLLFGSGDLHPWTLAHLEFTSTCISLFTAFLSMVVFYVTGMLAWRGTGSVKLALFLVAPAFLVKPLWLTLNSFGAPESFQFMCGMLLAGLTARHLNDGLTTARQNMRFIFVTSLICTTAIATKFTSIPFLLLPFLLLDGWRWKTLFILASGVFCLLYALPILLVEVNLNQFLLDFNAIVSSARSEQTGTHGSFSLQWALLRMFVSLPLKGSILAVLVVVAWTRRHSDLRRQLKQSWAGRVVAAALFTALLAFLFIAMRPKSHYFIPYLFLFSLALIGILHTLLRHRPDHPGQAVNPRTVMMAVAVPCVALSVLTFLSEQSLSALRTLRDDAMHIGHRVLHRSPEQNHAVIAAIPASNPYTAIAHANTTSKHLLQPLTAAVVPPNFYDYLHDGFTVQDHSGNQWNLRELKQRHDTLYFWGTRDLLQRHSGRQIAPHALGRATVFGAIEQLNLLNEVVTQPPFEPWREHHGHHSNGWVSGGCSQVAVPCLTAHAQGPLGENISTIRFYIPDEPVAQRMPRIWRLLASMDGDHWQVVHEQRERRPWKAGETRQVALSYTGFFRHHRLLGISGEQPWLEDQWASGVQMFFKRIPPERLTAHRADRMWLAGQREAAFSPLIDPPFWEQVGSFPMVIEREMGRPVRAEFYTMGTGNHGPDGLDSIGRMPTTWSVQGSEDGKRWTTLDHREQETHWQPDEWRLYAVARPGIYRWLRLIVEDGVSDHVLRLYALQFIDLHASGHPHRQERQGFMEVAGGMPVMIAFDFDRPITPALYQLVTDVNAPEAMDRMPSSWVMMGSMNGQGWNLMDKRMGQKEWRVGEHRTFEIAQPGPVRHIRLWIHDVAGHVGVLRMRHVTFFERDSRKHPTMTSHAP